MILWELMALDIPRGGGHPKCMCLATGISARRASESEGLQIHGGQRYPMVPPLPQGGEVPRGVFAPSKPFKVCYRNCTLRGAGPFSYARS